MNTARLQAMDRAGETNELVFSLLEPRASLTIPGKEPAGAVADECALKACPFCGNAGDRDPRHTFSFQDEHRSVVAVRCGQCGGYGPWQRFRQSDAEACERRAVDDWNNRAALAATPAPEAHSPATVAQADLDYENEHPAATRMRLEFEAQYGRSSALMRAANHWFNLRTQWNEAWNRDREEPVTEADVAEAERAMLAAQPVEREGGK